MVEQLGSGVPRILETYDRACFSFSQNFLKMTFLKESDMETNGQIGGPIGGSMEDLTERQKEILILIKTDQKLAKRKLAKMLKINVSAAQEHISVLKEKGIIERVGGTRGYWKFFSGA